MKIHFHRWLYPAYDFKMRRECTCGKSQTMELTRTGWRWQTT